jgi:hypothetical protein
MSLTTPISCTDMSVRFHIFRKLIADPLNTIPQPPVHTLPNSLPPNAPPSHPIPLPRDPPNGLRYYRQHGRLRLHTRFR